MYFVFGLVENDRSLWDCECRSYVTLFAVICHNVNNAVESVENLQRIECYTESNVVQVSEVNCEDYDLSNVAIHEVSNVNHTMQNDVHNPNSVCQYPMIPIQSDNHIVNDGENLLYATPIPYSHDLIWSNVTHMQTSLSCIQGDMIMSVLVMSLVNH